MSSGGGGSTSKQSQVTEIKAKDPTLVQDYLSPEYLSRLSDIANVERQRAAQSKALSQETTNRILSMYGKGPLYDPLIIVKSGQPPVQVAPSIETDYDTKHLIPSESFFKSANETNYRNLYEEQKKTNESLAQSVRQIAERAAEPAIQPRRGVMRRGFQGQYYMDRSGDN